MISLAPGLALGQPAPAGTDSRPPVHFVPLLRTPAPIADGAKSEVRELLPVRSAAARRQQGTASSNPHVNAMAFAAGATVGGYVGFGVAGRSCRCESSTGFVAGAAIGGVAALWLVRRLTHP